MSSVRSALDPLNAALGRTPDYGIPSSFSGLPIINQKVAALHPLTMQALMQVVQSTPPKDVLAALAQEQHTAPPTQPPHGPPGPPPPAPTPTIGYQFSGTDPGDSADNDYLIAVSGFLATETVDVIDSLSSSTLISIPPGSTRTTVAVPAGTALHLFARGETSKRVSNTVSFVA